jgi:hypothetical protein
MTYLELHRRFLNTPDPAHLFVELVRNAEPIVIVDPQEVAVVVNDFVLCYEEKLFPARFFSLVFLGAVINKQSQVLLDEALQSELKDRQLALKNLATTLIIQSLQVDPRALSFLGRLQTLLTK